LAYLDDDNSVWFTSSHWLHCAFFGVLGTPQGKRENYVGRKKDEINDDRW